MDPLGLRAKRESSGLSQAEAAALSGISQQHLSLIELGKLDPSVGTVQRLLEALGYELSIAARPAALRKSIAGLDKFNAWESREASGLSAEQGLARAFAVADFISSLSPLPMESREQRTRRARARRRVEKKIP